MEGCAQNNVPVRCLGLPAPTPADGSWSVGLSDAEIDECLAYAAPAGPSHFDPPHIRRTVKEIDGAGDCVSPGEVVVYCPDCGEPAKIKTRCRKRFVCHCPHCAKVWMTSVKQLTFDAAMSMKRPKLMTLTHRKYGGKPVSPEKHAEARNKLFHRLRRKGRRIDSWMAVIEEPNHQHILIDCDYIPQHTLSEEWHTVTGDSFIVDIRLVDTTKEGLAAAARYIAKYLGKGCHMDSKRAADWKGKRFFQSWGLPAASKWKRPLCSCGYVGPMKVLYGDAVHAYFAWWELGGDGPPPVDV